MPRKGPIPRREVLPDPIYGSRLAARFVNRLMYDGKKGAAEKIFYGALEVLAEKTGEEALRAFEKALENVKPHLEVKARRVGGATYQVPMEVRPDRQVSLSIRWLITYDRSRGEKGMSKKLAAGSHSIVLDVKVGSGAFMKTLDAGRELAEHMVTIGKACGRNVTAVLTNMDVPLGHRIGNALEVEEAVEILRGEGCPDLQEVCTVLASNMLMLCNGWDEETARAQVKEAIASGRAFEQMKRWVAAQGGDPAVLDDTSKLPQAAIQHEILAPRGGYLAHMDAQKIGETSALLGAGRQTKEDVIDFAAGVVLKKKTGERVEAGEVLAVLHTNRAESVPAAESAFLGALQWSDTAPEKQPLILGIVR